MQLGVCWLPCCTPIELACAPAHVPTHLRCLALEEPCSSKLSQARTKIAQQSIDASNCRTCDPCTISFADFHLGEADSGLWLWMHVARGDLAGKNADCRCGRMHHEHAQRAMKALTKLKPAPCSARHSRMLDCRQVGTFWRPVHPCPLDMQTI